MKAFTRFMRAGQEDTNRYYMMLKHCVCYLVRQAEHHQCMGRELCGSGQQSKNRDGGHR